MLNMCLLGLCRPEIERLQGALQGGAAGGLQASGFSWDPHLGVILLTPPPPSLSFSS